jgi:hypothetical protein
MLLRNVGLVTSGLYSVISGKTGRCGVLHRCVSHSGLDTYFPNANDIHDSCRKGASCLLSTTVTASTCVMWPMVAVRYACICNLSSPRPPLFLPSQCKTGIQCLNMYSTVASSCWQKQNQKLNSMVWVRERTIPTERPPLVGEVIAKCWRIEAATWSAWRIFTAVFSVFYTGAATFLSSSSSVVLTRLSGPRYRPTVSQKIW